MLPVHDERSAAPHAVGRLSLWDTVSVIVGIVIGAGIYETPPLILQNVSGPGAALAAWAMGGLLSFNGALTYAELASAYPRSGGDYVYLTRAYGPAMGFLFGWAQLTVILTGSIGMMAYVFADYASRLWRFHPETTLIYAGGAVVVSTLLNVFGVVLGKRVQNALSTAKILGLALVLLAGLLVPAEVAATPDGAIEVATESSGLALSSFAFAMVLVFITYGGWSDAAFFVAEMQDPKHIVRALFSGIAIITATYVLINFAYLHSLGFDAARHSHAVAADVAQRDRPQRRAPGVAASDDFRTGGRQRSHVCRLARVRHPGPRTSRLCPAGQKASAIRLADLVAIDAGLYRAGDDSLGRHNPGAVAARRVVHGSGAATRRLGGARRIRYAVALHGTGVLVLFPAHQRIAVYLAGERPRGAAAI